MQTDDAEIVQVVLTVTPEGEFKTKTMTEDATIGEFTGTEAETNYLLRFLLKLLVPPKVLMTLLLLTVPGLSQDMGHRTHPAADMPIHEKFYSTWYMPDNPTASCCNKADCYPTEIQYRGKQLYARRREDGAWLPIPEAKIERNRDSPDGRNHLCAPPPSKSVLPNTVYCFALGGGT